MVDGSRAQVHFNTHNHQSDAILFEFCRSICPGGSHADLTIRGQVAEARLTFPASKRKADQSLVIRPAKRQRINAEMNRFRVLYT